MNLLAYNAERADDDAGATRYSDIMQEMISLSPLLQKPYFNEQTGTNVTDPFTYGANEVSVEFDYGGMIDGQNVVFKVYIDDEDDPSWRVAEPWSLGESGSAKKTLSFAYSNTRVLLAGEYTVEMYVDNHLAQSGSFVVSEE